MLSGERITKAQIRLRGCAGWSVPLLFSQQQSQLFMRSGQFNNHVEIGKWIEQCLHLAFENFLVSLVKINIKRVESELH